MKKRLLALCLALIMVCSVAACGGSTSAQNKAASKEGVFKVMDFEQRFGAGEEDYLGLSQMRVVDDTIYTVADISFSNGSRTKYVSLDLEGNILKEHLLIEHIYATADLEKEEYEATINASATITEAEPVEEDTAIVDEPIEEIYTSNSYINNYIILEDGRLAYIKATDIYDGEMDEYVNKNELIICDVDGTEHLKVALTGLPEENNYFYANCMIPIGNEKMYLLSYDHAFVVDLETGEASYFIPSENVQNIYSVAFYKDNKPVVALWDEEYTKQTYSVVDIESGTVEEELDIPDTFSNFTFSEGGKSGYDLLLTNNNAIYGYNLGDEDKTLIINYLNSDLATYRLRNVSFMDENTFMAMYNDIVDYETHFAKFTKIPPSEVPDKEVITIAASSVDNTLKKEVIEFNKTSEDYRVTIQDYSEYNSQEDYTAGAKQLDMDILAGKIPDIVLCGSDFSMEKYADMGIFTDFYELLEQDETLSKEDFCENVLKAYEVDGKLYQFPISFDIMTAFGKTSIFGEDTSLTWDELEAILTQYPEAVAFSDMTQNDLLSYGLRFTYGQLVDEVTGECNFESDTFKNLLEFVKQYPEEIDWEKMSTDEAFWMDMESQYIEDRTLLSFTHIYSVYDGWVQGYRTFGEKATPVGFPTEEGNGSRVESPTSFAIYTKSENVDGAWAFIKRFVSEEAQMPDERNPHYSATGRLPILKKALEACALGVTQKPSYIGTDGNRVEYDEYIYINNEQVLVEPGTEADAQMWLDYILSIDKKTSANFDEALAIITEDAAGYLNGSKSLDEVVGIIQSRMTILVNEDK